MKVSVTMAVHDEEQYLLYSLKPFLKSVVDEIIFVLDRCTDNSEMIINRFKKITPINVKVARKNTKKWCNSAGESKKLAVSLSSKEIVLMIDADIIVERETVEQAKKILEQTDLKMVKFIYQQYSLYGSLFDRVKDEWINLLAKLTSKIQPIRRGIYMIKKDAFWIGDLPNVYDPLQQKLENVSTSMNGMIHLRPKYNKDAQIDRGRSRRLLPQYNLLKILLLSFIEFSPYTLIGWLKHGEN